MSWIKVERTLPRSPEVMRLAYELGISKREAFGIAVEWFLWLDDHSCDGRTGLTKELLDMVMDVPGLADALESVGWIGTDESGEVYVVGFEKHNGDTAKKRATDAARKASGRSGNSVSDFCPQNVRNLSAKCPQKNGQNAELEKEKNNIYKVGESNTVNTRGRPVSLPPPISVPDGFAEWCTAMCGAHPSASRSTSLRKEVMLAALDAFSRYPEAMEQAELVKAYFGSKMEKDSRGVRFYRPTGQERYFENLEDVVGHAERWGKEVRWGKPVARQEKPAEDVPAFSEAEAAAVAADVLAEMKGLHGKGVET